MAMLAYEFEIAPTGETRVAVIQRADGRTELQHPAAREYIDYCRELVEARHTNE